MYDVIIETVIDTLKLVPFLFLAFLLLEFFEHKMNDKTRHLIKTAGKLGPGVGSVLGAVPQCGFAAMASSMYATRVITLGTLIAVFLSTSDEMLVIMLSKSDPVIFAKGLIIIAIKVIIGLVAGFIIDFIVSRNKGDSEECIHDFCESHNCHCEHGIVRSAIVHTLKIAGFILIITFVLNFVIHFYGESTLEKLLFKDSIFSPFIPALVGFIPNCASSVIITEMYLANTISFGSCIAGLLTGSGMGLMILFKLNKSMKQNFIIAGIIYLIAVFCGIIFDLFSIII